MHGDPAQAGVRRIRLTTQRHQSGTMRVPASPIHMDNSAEPTPDRSLDMMKRSIVQTALKLAEDAGSWDAVHVHAIAREAGITLGNCAGTSATRMRLPRATSTSP